jgi:hypothetical protein
VLAEAVRDAVNRFPSGADGEAIPHARQTVEKFLDEFHAWVASDPPELHAAVPKTQARPPGGGTLKQALSVLLSVDWRNELAVSALSFVARETGVSIRIDPAVERLRFLADRRVSLHAEQITAERLLKRITELTHTELVPAAGGLIITTKEKALQYAVALRQDPASAEMLLRRMLPDEPAPRPVAGGTLPRVPAYLESAEEFTYHIELLLKQPDASAKRR